MLFTEFDIDVAKEVWQQEAREEGLEQGLELGLTKGKMEIVRNLLAMGLPVETIQKASGLPYDEIIKQS